MDKKMKKIPNIDPTSWGKWVRKDNYKMKFYRRLMGVYD